MFIGRATCVKRPEQIDIYNRLKSVRRHSRRGCRKISRRPTNQKIDLTVTVADLLHDAFESRVITNIGGKPDGCSSKCGDSLHGRVELFLSASYQGKLRALSRKSFCNTQVDTRATAGNDGEFPFEQTILEG